MPIIRRGERSQDPLDRHFLTIWESKWLIAGVALLAAIITYIALLFVPETFRVKSELYVNRLSTIADEETLNPEGVAGLLKSQPVVEKVRDDFAKAFGVTPPPAIEKFVKQFDVKSSILQDTTVRKQYSPVLSLQVDANGSSETRFIMESWIRNFIAEYGNYSTQEAVTKRDAYAEQKRQLEEEIARVEAKRSEYDAKLPYLKRILAEKLELLSQSRLQFQDQDVDTVKLDLSIDNHRMRPGLLERYAELQLQIDSGTAPSTAPQEMVAMETAIADARSSITAAEKDLSDVRYKQLQTVRHLQQLTGNQAAVNDALSKFTVAAAIYKNDTSDLPAGADVRALSMPVMPETRVWPKRTLTAALVAVAVAIFTAVWIVARNFLTRNSASDMQ